jgi:hypothetical protein
VCRSRVTAADHEHRFAGIFSAILAEDVFEPAGDLGTGRDFADGGNAALPEPARLAIGARTVQNDLGLGDRLLTLGVSDE